MHTSIAKFRQNASSVESVRRWEGMPLAGAMAGGEDARCAPPVRADVRCKLARLSLEASGYSQIMSAEADVIKL